MTPSGLPDTPEPRTGTDELIDALGKAGAERDAAVEERDGISKAFSRWRQEAARELAIAASRAEAERDRYKAALDEAVGLLREAKRGAGPLFRDEIVAFLAALSPEEKP